MDNIRATRPFNFPVCGAILLFAVLSSSASSLQAEIILYASYALGEPGSLYLGNRPLDGSGNNRHFTHNAGSSGSVGTTGVSAPGSTAYLDTSDVSNGGWYSPGLFSSLPNDNFALGIFTRAAANTSATRGDVFITGGSRFGVTLGTNGWGAINGGSWIGNANGYAGSFSADTWVHLALIRSGGSTEFYIDGVGQGASYLGTPANGEPHISVNSGGSVYFDGHLDEARVVTFTAGETASTILNSLQGVPEPTSFALFGVVMVVGLTRRRRI